ncbi:YVTN family beta-propeller protein [Mucilaginibacter rubeus]|uniref:YncE family protein n=1 Tax=Mucilaginibacter rubeus TaxID=2027860 RepID=UPI0033955840
MNKTAFAPNFKAMRFDMVKLLVVSILWIPMVFISNKCSAQATPSRVLLALSKSDHNLAIINPVTLKVIARIPVGSDPHEVIASADGKTAYVSIYGGGSLHELSVIDLVAQKALPAIDTKPLMGPHGLTFAGGKVWFSAEGAKAVGRYDPATGKFDWAMGTGQDRTHMIYVTDDGKKVFTTNVSSATVSILEDSLLKPMGPPGGFAPPARHDWVQTVVPVAKGSEGFDVSPNGRELWTAGAEDGNISIVDIAAKRVTATIDAKVAGANRLKFTPDGKRVLVTSLRTGDLFVFDATSHQEIKRINTGHRAAGILVNDDGSRAFIGCTGDNYVAVIDLNKLEVTGHIDIRGADGLAWALMR